MAQGFLTHVLAAGLARGACPVGAITVDDECCFCERRPRIDCGACEGACPTGAITAE